MSFKTPSLCGNIYESACDNIAALVLALAALKNVPMLDGDARLVAEDVADRLDLSDIHALVDTHARTVYDAAISRGDHCLDRIGAAYKVLVSRLHLGSNHDLARVAQEVDAVVHALEAPGGVRSAHRWPDIPSTTVAAVRAALPQAAWRRLVTDDAG